MKWNTKANGVKQTTFLQVDIKHRAKPYLLELLVLVFDVIAETLRQLDPEDLVLYP